MTGHNTRHVATWSPDAAADGNGAWVVSWLPLRLLTRNQAITAMTIAETVGTTAVDHTHPMWPHLISWAAELDLTGPDAVARATRTA